MARLRYGLETIPSIPQALSHSFPGDMWTLRSCSHNPTNPPTQSQRKAQSHFAQALQQDLVEEPPFWWGSDVATWQSSSRTLVDTSLDERELARCPILYSPKIYHKYWDANIQQPSKEVPNNQYIYYIYVSAQGSLTRTRSKPPNGPNINRHQTSKAHDQLSHHKSIIQSRTYLKQPNTTQSAKPQYKWF